MFETLLINLTLMAKSLEDIAQNTQEEGPEGRDPFFEQLVNNAMPDPSRTAQPDRDAGAPRRTGF